MSVLSSLSSGVQRAAVSLKQARRFILAGAIVVVSVLAIRQLGLLQPLELLGFDQLVRLRPAEPTDQRFVIVGITEADLAALNRAQISDRILAELITNIREQQPALIALDLYRNLPVGVGQEELDQVLSTTPNLIGIQKVVGGQVNEVEGNPILAADGRIAASDIAIDFDGRVRRGLLFPDTTDPNAPEGLSLRIALDYLALQDIQPDPESLAVLKLGSVTFPRVTQNAGGYVRADAGGYQILINLRAAEQSFTLVSATEVLDQTLPNDFMTDKIVMIGNLSSVDSDIFFTAFNRTEQQHTLYGVEIHAAVASQIISAVLDKRPIIQVLPEWLEILYLTLSVYVGLWVSQAPTKFWQRGISLIGLGAIAIVSGYVLLLQGWWLPTALILFALLPTALASIVLSLEQLDDLATRDELTQIANRRTFNEQLQADWMRAVRAKKPLSIILCDIDYFKLYNDTYGHLEGDTCLHKVAQVLASTVQSPRALVARYGGEEFIVLLPNLDGTAALSVANTIRAKLKQQTLPHHTSKVSKFVSLSLGVAMVVPTFERLPSDLVSEADLALYKAKAQGRDRAVLQSSPEQLSTTDALQLLPETDRYLRRLLRQNWDCLQQIKPVVKQTRQTTDPLASLDHWLHYCYPQPERRHSISDELNQLAKSHQELSAFGALHRQELDELAIQIFSLLGFELNGINAGAKARILIIDDRPDNTFLLALALKRQGYQVQRLHDSTIAL
ncbi:MAG: CHASE2 domain-containing protein, partial [Cyanobacteria bacterium P01_H01_bin.121]